ncbi:hypothetical protein ACFZBU_43225 [Embleya sp. NPDC008237]|uniref:hypothetical protein n=1 Tax=Embleya sp. NPDC008237 TaxID=3363978 RepID=UPI0036E7A7BB
MGVGPLRFGMTFDEVRAALLDPTSYIPGRWMEFDDLGVSLYFGEGASGLCAVALHAERGPQVRIGDVDLVG